MLASQLLKVRQWRAFGVSARFPVVVAREGAQCFRRKDDDEFRFIVIAGCEIKAWVMGKGAIGDYLHWLYTNNPHFPFQANQ